MNEQDTKAACIDPIIESLGWDVRDPDVVRREFRPKERRRPCRLRPRLTTDRGSQWRPRALGEPLDDRRFIKQTLGYAVMAGVPWCVLTDGDRWHLFNATATVDADAKLFWQVRVSEPADNHRAGSWPATSSQAGISQQRGVTTVPTAMSGRLWKG